MKTNTRFVIGSVALLVILALLYVLGTKANQSSVIVGKQIDEKSTSVNQKNLCIADECLFDTSITYPIGALPSDVQSALDRAYEDEHHAHTFYSTVISTFGQMRPFIMIVRSEQTHMASLQALYDKYGIVPPTLSADRGGVPTTFAAACASGVEAEKSNIALYEKELLPKVAAYPDITQVFTRLMDASRDRHLPAFERCAR